MILLPIGHLFIKGLIDHKNDKNDKNDNGDSFVIYCYNELLCIRVIIVIVIYYVIE